MRIIIACEFSQIVAEAFTNKGHDVLSCDLLPGEKGLPHYQGDVLRLINDGWDMMIAFPPCTYITTTANRSFLNNPERWEKRVKALIFVKQLLDAPIDKIALENPKGAISTHIRKPDQIIHPFYFGDEAQKTTCLWLKNLPLLKHSKTGDMFSQKTHVKKGEMIKFPSGKKMPKWYADLSSTNNKNNAKIRSLTFQGIADAMADQWGNCG